MARRMTTQRRALKSLGNFVLLLMLLWTAIPFYWMIATSLKHDKEIYGYEATLIPEKPTLQNYATVFRETPYLLFLRNSVIVAYLGFDVPFCTWLLMGYFRSIPADLEDAARVDGCNRVGALVRIVLPMSLPALVVVTFFSFTHAWNEFLYAHVFTSTTSARTVTTGLVNFMSQDVFFWGPLMASTVMSALPPVLMFLVFQRWVVKGLTLGGVKG